MRNDLSIVILTYNETLNIQKCLEEASKITKEIIIIDSYSTDTTLEICKKYNCKVFQNKFINQAKQLNWALENVPFDTEWVLRLDADEFFTEKLMQELQERLNTIPANVSGVFFKRRVYFMDKWIKHGGYYPTLLLRMWRKDKAICEERWMDEHMKLLEGDSITFEHDFIDYNQKNITWWIAKHNNYATREAIEQLNIEHKFLTDDYVDAKPLGTQEQRKRWIKEKVYTKLPLGVRPFLYFFYRYFFKLGFLDGFRGFTFHVLQGFWYRFLVDIKVYELLKKQKEQNCKIEEVILNEYNINIKNK